MLNLFATCDETSDDRYVDGGVLTDDDSPTLKETKAARKKIKGGDLDEIYDSIELFLSLPTKFHEQQVYTDLIGLTRLGRLSDSELLRMLQLSLQRDESVKGDRFAPFPIQFGRAEFGVRCNSGPSMTRRAET